MTREVLPGKDEFHWGVDVGARKITVAFHGAITSYETVSLADFKPGAKRLAYAYEYLHHDAATWAENFPPLAIWVERPTGSFPNPALDHTVGVVMAALWHSLRDTYCYPVPVELIPVGTWKKVALRFGNASKSQVLTWVRENLDYTGDDHDVADALAIAYAGARYATFDSSPQAAVSGDAAAREGTAA